MPYAFGNDLKSGRKVAEGGSNGRMDRWMDGCIQMDMEKEKKAQSTQKQVGVQDWSLYCVLYISAVYVYCVILRHNRYLSIS